MRKRILLITAIFAFAITSHALAAVHPYWGKTRQAVPTPQLRGTTRTLQHPVWGSSQPAEQASQKVPNVIGHPYYDRSTEAEYADREDARKDRVCERVKKRFGADRSVFERVNSRLKDRFGYTCTPSVITEEDIEGAELRIARSTFHPVGDTISKGASRIPVLSTVFSASCAQDVTIDDVLITNFGLGLVSDIPYLWMSIDGARVSRTRELGRNKNVQLRFKRPLTIPRCESVTVDFFAAFSETALASALHTFSIDEASHVFANATVTGDFPIAGERFRISSGKTGTLTVSYLPIEEDPKLMGMDDEVIGRFKVQLDTTEDQTIRSITLEQDGSAIDGDYVGIYLRTMHGHARMTEIEDYTHNDFITFQFDPPQPIEKGGSIELDVVANIVANTGSTIQLGLGAPVDLYSVGQRYGYGKNGQLYGSHVEIEGEPDRLKIR